MQPKDISPDQAIGRVLDELIQILGRRQNVVRDSRDQLLRKPGVAPEWRLKVQSESMGNIDGLQFAKDQINDVRAAAIAQLRAAGRI